MKSLLLVVMLIGTSALAQNQSVVGQLPTPKTHNFGVGIEPHWLLIQGMGLKLDGRITDRFALELGGMYVFPHSVRTTFRDSSDNVTREESYNWTQYEVYMGTKFMITGSYDRSGVFVAPAVGYTSTKITDYSKYKLQGSLESPMARLTAGYQFVVSDFRFNLGAGGRLTSATDIVIKDEAGKEVLRERSSSFGGVALDFHAAFLF